MIDRLIDISNGTLLGMCLLWALHFMTAPSDNAPKRLWQWTGVLMLVISAMTLSWIVGSFLFPSQLEDVGLSVTVGLLSIPFTVFVMMELTRLCNVTCRHVVMHLSIPALMTAAYVVQLVWNVYPTDSAQVQGRHITFLLYCIWMGCYTLYYIYRFAVAAHRYEEIVGDIYADIDGRSINWLRRILNLVLTIVAVFVILMFYLDNHEIWITYNIFFGLFVTILCHNIGLMRDNHAIKLRNVSQTVTAPVKLDIKQKEEQELLSKFKSQIVKEELYLQPNLTREIAAKALLTNHIELIHCIKSQTGMTFSQFITSIRLERAAELLTSTEMTADEIVYACGFRSSSTFYRHFTEHYHCSPIEYRQNNNK